MIQLILSILKAAPTALTGIKAVWAILQIIKQRRTNKMSNEQEKKINELADKLIADIKSAGELVDSIKAAKDAMAAEPNIIKKVLAGIRAGSALVNAAIEKVELVGEDLKLAGPQKRELAVAVINKLVDIPYVPENLEAIIIGFAVDNIVNAFNAKFGKGWLAATSNPVTIPL